MRGDAAPDVVHHSPGARGAADVHSRLGRAVDEVGPPLLAVLGLVTASRWINTPSPTVLPILQAFVPLAAVPSWILASAAALTRRWRLATAAVALAAVHVALLAPWHTSTRRAADLSSNDRLVVVSSNLFIGRGDLATLVDAVRELDADVLVLVEATPAMRETLEGSDLADRLPYSSGEPRADGNAVMVYSRHPLRTSDVEPVPPLRYGAHMTTVAAPAGDVVVAGLHAVAPLPGLVRAWRAEWTAVAAWAASLPPELPVIIAGDFNASMDHPVLRRLGRAGLVDVHREVGRGRPATWPRIPGASALSPWFHIDHIQSRGFDVVDAGTLVVPGSDHLATWAALVPSASDQVSARSP